jgi:hypothetical protein
MCELLKKSRLLLNQVLEDKALIDAKVKISLLKKTHHKITPRFQTKDTEPKFFTEKSTTM